MRKGERWRVLPPVSGGLIFEMLNQKKPPFFFFLKQIPIKDIEFSCKWMLTLIFLHFCFHFIRFLSAPFTLSCLCIFFFKQNPFLQLTRSPPPVLPLQLSASRVCLPPPTTAPPSSHWVPAPAATRSRASPRASPSRPSVRPATTRHPRHQQIP